ncbi:MAG: hypothetical protein KZQ70_06365 [gamma proteobacterium symbiont of Lucinoma myriamae]|nr:hypothetical protein [gamma proteobacterium symbiont of Lucinoma myriamae]MCU7818424.1 hypothetical protein [gamma proteobacterium symbiont of Lucinoma myriamae]MCU7832153.1 hypothetical protein [gamma proteobacterium symbiont of Lucinoma myriamae]
MRKSILACTVSFLMSPVASWALGMGDIQVNSTLNQPLNAEIALHSVAKKDLDTLRVGLAPKTIYSRANIEHSDYLSKFSFKILQRGGKSYVSITTRKPFREPFANFLIEAVWGSGRLLKEYTMLLDPPEFIKKQTRAVTTASASRSSQVKRTQPKSAKSTATKSKSNYVLTPADSNGELAYGPTKRNDTLWVIAKNMAPANVSVDQMMMALLRDNPDAFINNNINNLKAGYVLRIKNRESLNKLSRSMANRQVKEQYQNWKNTRKQKTDANIVDRSITTPESKATDGQLKEKLALTTEDLESKEVQNQELRTRIKELEELLKTKSSLVQLKDESLADLQRQQELASSDESVTTDDISKEVQTTDEVTIDIQTTDDLVKSEAEEETIAVTESILSEHIDPSVELTKDEMANVDVDMPVTEPATINEIIAATEVIETKPVVQPVAKPSVKSDVKPKPKAKPVIKPAPKPLPQENVIDVLLSEDMLPYTAGGGLLVLIFAWLGLRGRGKKENEFEESILDSQLTDDASDFAIEDSELVESSKDVLASDNETSFLSDFSADDMESLQPDDTEADPISEADVFMVYGRYQQAEELLQGALKNEPERLDYQMKLLEVYHGDNLKDSFAIQADVVKGLLQKSNDDYELTSEWTKAKSWADKLELNIDMPDSFDEDISANEDFSIDEDSAVEDTAESELSMDDLSDDLSLDTEELNLNEDSILGDDNSNDDDLSLSLDDSFDTAEGSLELEPIDESSELSLDDLDEGTDSESSNDTDLSLEELVTDDNSDMLDLESTLQLDDSLDVEDNKELELENLELDNIDDIDTSLELADDSDDSEMSLELDDVDSSEMSLELDDVDGSEMSFELDTDDDSEISLELDDSDTVLETDDTGAALAEDDDLELFDSEVDFDDLEDDFPELDAVGTKLDLAKAYIDMGDMESASSILNEVIDEGDDEQKSQAQSLLEQTTS